MNTSERQGPEHSTKWDVYFMGMAHHAAGLSKDPSTKVGAVAVRNRRVLGTGYNGYPAGVPDVNLESRDYKLERTVHAEMNVICWAAREGVSLEGASLYVWPYHPCLAHGCARHVVAAGFREVVIPRVEWPPRWAKDFYYANALLLEGGLTVRKIDYTPEPRYVGIGMSDKCEVVK